MKHADTVSSSRLGCSAQQEAEARAKTLQKATGFFLLGLQAFLIMLRCIGCLEEALTLKLLAFLLTTTTGVLMLPRPKKRVPPRWAIWATVVFILVSTIVVCVLPWSPVPVWPNATELWGPLATLQALGPEGYEHGPFLEYIFNILCVAVVTPMFFVCLLAWNKPSSYGSQAVRIVAAVWLSSIIWTLQDFAMYGPDRKATLFLTFLALTFDPVHWAATMVLFMRRAEQVTNKPQCRPRLIMLAWLACTTENFISVSPVLQNTVHTNVVEIILSIIGDIFLVVFVMVCAWPLTRRLGTNHKLLRMETAKLVGVPKMEALWAAKMIRSEIWAIVSGLVAIALMRGFMTALMILKVSRFSYQYLFIAIFPYRIYQIVHCGSLVVLSGLLWSKKAADRPQLPSRSQGTSATRLGAEERIWNSKVKELAERGFTLRSLLGFMEVLIEGSTMPSFDPERSTTNDVVRQAIIPMSKGHGEGEGVALATIWNRGRPKLAERMVTHNWSNLFTHLVAAIVADGLNYGQYDSVVDRLCSEEGLEDLRAELEGAGAIERTYWVCAFSVNQHSSICAGFGSAPEPDSEEFAEWKIKTCDSVTGLAFAPCTCNTAKYFNNEPAHTELNKFDDMMALLARTAPGFAHVIAVDRTFDVFMRAWCVAEMVEGGSLRVPQKVIIYSDDCLDFHYEQLASLDVRDCKATRPEDKEEILSRIEDVAKFNEYLQWMLFDVDGLFAGFIDQEARLTAVGSILQRVERSSLRSLSTESNDADSSAGTDSNSTADFTRRSGGDTTRRSGSTRRSGGDTRRSGGEEEAAGGLGAV